MIIKETAEWLLQKASCPRFNIKLLVAFTFSIAGCNKADPNDRAVPEFLFNLPDTVEQRSMQTPQLATAYCGGCHLYPEPSLLPRSVWKKSVLPEMAKRLGLYSENQSPYNKMHLEEQFHSHQAQIYPDAPLILPNIWDKLVAYYLNHAPESLPVSPQLQASHNLPIFQTITPIASIKSPPLITLITYDSISNQLLIGSGNSNLSLTNLASQHTTNLVLDSPPTACYLHRDSTLYVLTSGVFNPSDIRSGALYRYRPPYQLPDTMLTGLPRPVHLSVADLNADGQNEYVICGFGYRTGYLAWYEGGGNQELQSHILSAAPGAIRTEILDFDGDSRLDIAVLMAQGNEGIFIYLNKGDKQFERKKLLSFPPVWGSSYFTFIDWDRDGDKDILYTNGDNADYSYLVKPYHGVRIYLNNGNNQFHEAFFQALPGAYKVIPKDFDKDGDIDLAVSSFFPDFEVSPTHGFVYLENTSTSSRQIQFDAHTSPDALWGRWLIMEEVDWDQDQDQDLILGSYIPAPTPVPDTVLNTWRRNPINIWMLENTTLP